MDAGIHLPVVDFAGEGFSLQRLNNTVDSARDHGLAAVSAGGGFPNALVTMWTWITDDRADAERVLTEILAPMLNRDPDQLRGRLCIGSVAACAELLSQYAAAGCQRVFFWPMGDERRQVERIAETMQRTDPGRTGKG